MGVGRRRTNITKSRERRTLIPSFDPQALAKEIEAEANRTTIAPPFDPSSYARIVDEHVSRAGEVRDTPGTMAAAAATAAAFGVDDGPRTVTEVTPIAPVGGTEQTLDAESAETIGREMYGCYLASDFPEALVLAERVLERQPEHALAQLVLKECKERLEPSMRALSPSSVLRLKFAELERQSKHIDPTSSFVLGHIDGISDAATVAALTGLPGPEALERLHALLDLGVLEVVSA
jgi:hypothetical protein